MYLVILIILIAAVIFFFRDFKSFVYLIGILEIFFKLVHFISVKLGSVEFTKLVNEYIPDSIISIMNEYAKGIFLDILIWGLVLVMCWFLYYLIVYLFKKKK